MSTSRKEEDRPTADQLFQAFTLDQFHRNIRRACLFTHVINRNDIGMLQPARGLCLAVKIAAACWDLQPRLW